MAAWGTPVPFGSEHDRATFDSGAASLDRWLREHATQATKNGAARTYVVCEEKRVVGYYALCTYSVEATNAPAEERIGPLSIPAVLLARLAVDRGSQGRSLGRVLLVDALRRAVAVADQVGVKLFVVHALHEHAAAFYATHGFRSLALETPLTMYLPMKAVRATFEGV